MKFSSEVYIKRGGLLDMDLDALTTSENQTLPPCCLLTLDKIQGCSGGKTEQPRASGTKIFLLKGCEEEGLRRHLPIKGWFDVNKEPTEAWA